MEKKQKAFKVGILGAGNIAGSMAKALNGLAKAGEIVPWAVASRSLQKSESFAEEWNFERAYGSYEEHAADSECFRITGASYKKYPVQQLSYRVSLFSSFTQNFYFICSSCFLIIRRTISPPIEPASREVKSPL